MSTMDDRWVAFLIVDDRTGALTAATECFSTRGVSFESVNTLDVHEGRGVLAFVFAGTERLARVLMRTLQRLASVREVRVCSAADPDVRAMAHATIPADAGAIAETARDADADVIPVGAHAAIVTGSLAAVEHVTDAFRDAGANDVARIVLPPVWE
ncbi:hypothetical protein [Microbacterium sp.]|uniref:hypothetical protein n=1 Tax=Microbacterium sp. TaxID=51671 RepID=UPI003C7299A5